MRERIKNEMKLEFSARSINEAFARTAVAAFASQTDPSVAVIADLKTAVSEAVTNCIVHGYFAEHDKSRCPIYISCRITEGKRLIIKIKDRGCGICDVKTAMQPLYTTDTDGERSGMGCTVMESLCDCVRVCSKIGKGTTVTLEKRLDCR